MGIHYSHLDLRERIEIAHLRRSGLSLEQIGQQMGRSGSTISRELRRNSGDRRSRPRPDEYDPLIAENRRWMRRRMHRRFKMACQPDLRAFVRDRLAMGWSPEQISGWLAREQHPMQISHESIYRFIEHRRRQHDPWHHFLPEQRFRRGQRRRRPGHLGHYDDRVPVWDRDPQANARAVGGHWEGDLMCFSRPGAVLLISHERVSRYTDIRLFETKTSQPLMEYLAGRFGALPEGLRRSITFDNGVEFTRYPHLQETVGMDVYFCAIRSPWQKGGVENAIRRLRRYLPRTTEISDISKAELEAVQDRYNNIPRKCLGYRTPHEVFDSLNRLALRS